MSQHAKLVFLARPGIDAPAEMQSSTIQHHQNNVPLFYSSWKTIEGLVLHTLIKPKPKGKEQLLGCALQVISEYIATEL